MWLHDEDSLIETLTNMGVEEQHRWVCPCKPDCLNVVRFGIGLAGGLRLAPTATMGEIVIIQTSGEWIPPTRRALWVVCSFSYDPESVLFAGGIDASEDLAALLLNWRTGPEHRRRQADLLTMCCAMGLGGELEAELKKLKAA